MKASDFERALRVIMATIRVELRDEFDRNFERQAFFSEKWQRRKASPRDADAALLIQTSSLRKSIKAEVRGNSVVFTSDHPAAIIHNDGGEIVVTAKMKRYFRFKFYQAMGMTRPKEDNNKPHRPLSDGGFYAWTAKMEIGKSKAAQFYRLMALKKVGSTVKIPRRRFIGEAPEVVKAVEEIITTELTKYFDNLDIIQH